MSMLRRIKRHTKVEERKKASKELKPAYARYLENAREAGEEPMPPKEWLKSQGW